MTLLSELHKPGADLSRSRWANTSLQSAAIIAHYLLPEPRFPATYKRLRSEYQVIAIIAH